VDEQLQTTAPNIFAIGDCIGGPLLAHKAMHEGILAVEGIAGIGGGKLNAQRIPNCTYCEPQVASLGLTEEHAREQDLKIKVGRFPFQANGKALALSSSEGLVKVIADSGTGEILGVHIIGPEATELIAEAGSAMTLEATPEAIAHVVHAHPTLSEAFAEANLAILGRAVHL
ncbi:MAG: FAD-dependent oxidoreductase, partial [Candidatus Methylomirabilales bacterium]